MAPLAPETAPEQALRQIVAVCRDDLLKYRKIVLASRRAVGIHQARVALRRMRAAFSLFRTAASSELSAREMQALAAEFNLSETTFVLPPSDPRNTARVRIVRREIALAKTIARQKRAGADPAKKAPAKAKKFVEAIKKRQKPGKKNLAQALSRIAELEARLDAMEALKDLEEEEQG